VTALFSKQAEVLLEITVTADTASSQGSTGDRIAGEVSGTDPPESPDSLTVTPEHPFWEPTQETWTPAGDLQPGDHLLQRDGDLLTITRITTLDRTTPFTVYNFTVAGTHNYYATTLDTLVHNCDFAPGKADEHFDKHVLGLDDAGQATRTPDMPEYDIVDLDKGFDNYVADAKSLMCPETCPTGAREAIRSDGVVIRLDAHGRIGMRNGNTITTYFRPNDSANYFARQAAR